MNIFHGLPLRRACWIIATPACEGMAADSDSIRRQRIGPVIAEQFQVMPDQWIDSFVDAVVQAIVKIAELDRGLREGEAAALG
jgi:hypothetical protein